LATTDYIVLMTDPSFSIVTIAHDTTLILDV